MSFRRATPSVLNVRRVVAEVLVPLRLLACLWCVVLGENCTAQDGAWLGALGFGGIDRVHRVERCDDGSLVVAGTTTAGRSWQVSGAGERAFGSLGGSDVFVARVGPDRRRLLWVSVIGGGDAERATALGIGPDGSIVVAGTTRSEDLPTTRSVFQRRFAAAGPLLSIGDAFLCRFGPDGELRHSTYLGRDGDETIEGLLVEDDGSVVVCGHTTSQVFPTTAGAFQETFRSVSVLVPDAFLACLGPDLSDLRWSTLFGGSSADWFLCIERHPGGGYLCGGWHASLDLLGPAPDEALAVPGLRDAVVAWFSARGERIERVWSFGGEGFEQVVDLAVVPGASGTDDAPVLVATGWTDDPKTFPGGAEFGDVDADEEEGDGRFHDGFLVCLEPAAGGSIRGATGRSSLFGGPEEDHPVGLAVRGRGDAVEILVAGETRSDRFPIDASRLENPRATRGFVLGFGRDLEPGTTAARFAFARVSRVRDLLVDGEELMVAGWATGFLAHENVRFGVGSPAGGVGESSAGYLFRLSR